MRRCSANQKDLRLMSEESSTYPTFIQNVLLLAIPLMRRGEAGNPNSQKHTLTATFPRPPFPATSISEIAPYQPRFCIFIYPIFHSSHVFPPRVLTRLPVLFNLRPDSIGFHSFVLKINELMWFWIIIRLVMPLLNQKPSGPA